MENKLGDFVKKIRNERKLSLRAFGKLCDISHSHIDSIEKGVDYRTGKPVRITNETLSKLSAVTGVAESVLLTLSLNKPFTKLPDYINLGSHGNLGNPVAAKHAPTFNDNDGIAKGDYENWANKVNESVTPKYDISDRTLMVALTNGEATEEISDEIFTEVKEFALFKAKQKQERNNTQE